MFQLCFNLFVFNERLWTNFRNMISLVEFVVSSSVFIFGSHGKVLNNGQIIQIDYSKANNKRSI